MPQDTRRYSVIDNNTRESYYYVNIHEELRSVSVYNKTNNTLIYESSCKQIDTCDTPAYSNHFLIAHLDCEKYLVVKGTEAYVFTMEENDDYCRWDVQYARDPNEEYLAIIGTKNMYFLNEHISVPLDQIESHSSENNVNYIVKLDKIAEANTKPLQMEMSWH